MKRVLLLPIVMVLVMAIPMTARVAKADTYTFTGASGGYQVSGTAVFTRLSDGDLQIVVTNTSTYSATEPSTQTRDITDVLFSLSTGSPVLSFASAVGPVYKAGTKNGVYQGCLNLLDTVRKGGWEFASPPADGPKGVPYEYGFATAGENGIFQNPHDILGASDYGIAAKGTDLSADGYGSNNTQYIVEDYATFVIKGFGSSGVNLSQITDVALSWATSADITPVEGEGFGGGGGVVPEPISLIFFGTGLAAVGGFVTRRRMQ